MNRSVVIAFIIASATALSAPVLAGPPVFPDVIALPGGFFPEGIAIGQGTTAYVGSLVDGAIWKGDVRTGEGAVLVAGVPGRIAVGMDHDARSGHLWVAGGPDGNAYVYDGNSGSLVDVLDLVPGGFVNDVIVTRRAAYLTDSFAPQLYEVPLTANGTVSGPPRTIPLTGSFQFQPGQFNANGIEASPDGGTLIVVNSFFGELYTVPAGSGAATTIELGGAVVNGDGLVLVGRTLYAVEGGKNQITEIALAAGYGAGTVTDTISSPSFDVPTTAARHGRSLYAVNAKFGTPPLPTTPYEIVRVDR